jgi:hypothetical protein
MCLFEVLDILEEFGISGILEHFSIKSKDFEVDVQRLLVLFSCIFVKCPGLAWPGFFHSKCRICFAAAFPVLAKCARFICFL